MTRADAVSFVLEVEASGGSVSLDGEKVILDGDVALSPVFRARAAALKPQLLTLLRDNASQIARDSAVPHVPHDLHGNTFPACSSSAAGSMSPELFACGSCGSSGTGPWCLHCGSMFAGWSPTAMVVTIAVEPGARQAHLAGRTVCAAALPDGRVFDWFLGSPPPGPVTLALSESRAVAALEVQRARGAIAETGLVGTRWIDAAGLARLAHVPTDPAALAANALGAGGAQGFAAGQGAAVSARGSASRRALVRLDALRLRKAWDSKLAAFDSIEPEVRQVDAAINERGFAFDRRLADAIVWCEHEIGERARREAGGSNTIASPEKLRAALADAGVHAADVRRETLLALLDSADLPDDARALIAARLASSGIVGHKLRSALRHLDADGRLRGSLVYCRAHTGRCGVPPVLWTFLEA